MLRAQATTQVSRALLSSKLAGLANKQCLANMVMPLCCGAMAMGHKRRPMAGHLCSKVQAGLQGNRSKCAFA